MNKSFIIKGREIKCEILRSQRKTVAISVLPDKRVEIKVPIFTSFSQIEKFLTKHSRWVFNRLDAPEKKIVAPKKFISGELHYFLGKQYPIFIETSTRNYVVFENDAIHIYHKNKSYASDELYVSEISYVLDCWYFEQARRVFKECADPLVKQMTKYHVAPKSFTIKKMKTRWGSCSSRGSISLNLDLIKLPKECIKSVILHELCHLVHMNHSKDFYALMTAEMPDWKIWDKQLKFL